MKAIIIDTPSKSITESLANTIGGFPLAYLIGILILPVSTTWLEHDPLVANLAISSIFAGISFFRSYYLRRFFTKFGLDANLLKLIIQVLSKYKNKFICGNYSNHFFIKIILVPSYLISSRKKIFKII